MIFIGIDVAKDKHNCFIINSDGEVLFNAFAISNNKARFDELYIHFFLSVIKTLFSSYGF